VLFIACSRLALLSHTRSVAKVASIEALRMDRVGLVTAGALILIRPVEVWRVRA